jgi:predicted outer membrane repeat protein
MFIKLYEGRLMACTQGNWTRHCRFGKAYAARGGAIYCSEFKAVCFSFG